MSGSYYVLAWNNCDNCLLRYWKTIMHLFIQSFIEINIPLQLAWLRSTTFFTYCV